jgi:hypothetical protein
MGTATVGIVMPSRPGVSNHSVNATAAARVGRPTIASRARFLINRIRQKGAPSDKPWRIR